MKIASYHTPVMPIVMPITRRRLLAGLGPAALARAARVPLTQVEVFQSGQDGYHTYRIPSLLVTRRGTLLAFCEGRRHSPSDSGDIDLVLKRSFDHGRTWSAQQLITDLGDDTIGNPCPVQDRQTGVIWLPLTRNPGRCTQQQILDRACPGTRTVWMCRSQDDGATWSAPADITAAVKAPDWTWYATGPGVGIQLRRGRLLIPCDHYRQGTQARYSHVIYSDDHGRTWKIGGVAGEKTNECQVAELADGSLVLNMRSYHGANRRAIARSRDGGLTWSESQLDQALIEPVCQASLLRLRGNTLLFSNPADTRRVRMTVRLSYDGGRTWPVSRLLHQGPSIYSCLGVLRDNAIACLYERGDQRNYERITLARFGLDWLRSGNSSG